MPSEFQSGGSSEEFESKPAEFIARDMEIRPLLRGVRSRERAQVWCKWMNRSEREFGVGLYELLMEGVE